MWVIPSNLLPSLAIAQDYAASKEELNERLGHSEPLLLWKSKPLSSRTWWPAWNRVWWFRALSGRILKPSMQNHFVERYTALWAVIPASHSVTPETEKEPMIHDTFTHIWSETSKQLSLFGASSKTSQDTLHLDSTRFTEAYQVWAMQLRQDCTQRRKLARHMNGNGYSSSQYERIGWPTPDCSDRRSSNSQQQGLSNVVKNWATPRVFMYKDASFDRGKTNLGEQVVNPKLNTNWPTATTRDYKGCGNAIDRKDGKSRMDTLEAVAIYGRQDQENRNTNGKNREQLNHAWVAQLMGTTLEKTFFVPMVMESWNKQQK